MVDGQLFRRLRDARRLAFRAAAIVDGPANRLNQKRPWPPIYMRREVGPLRSFESSAVATVARLEYEAGLKEESRLLDVGCGCGALPLALNLYGTYGGQYLGLDVDQRMIGWCQKHLQNENIHFAHHNYWSETYNPNGVQRLPFAVEDAWADVLLMKSVLTHMLPDDTSWYLQETARALAPEGTAVLTAVLYDQVTEDIQKRFPYDGGVYRYLREASPVSSIALHRPWVDEQMKAVGLTYTYTPNPIQGTMLVRGA